MARRNPFSRFTSSTPSELNHSLTSLNESTKDLETALKEIEVALDKLEELQKLRREVVSQTASGPSTSLTPSRPAEDEDSTFRSVPVYTANTIVPVLISTFFRS